MEESTGREYRTEGE